MKHNLKTNFKNVLKCSKGSAESDQHKDYKYIICSYMWSHSIDFYTEAVFNNNSRSDVYIPAWDLAIEIMYTEKYKDAIKKKYPCNVLFIPATVTRLEVYTCLADLSVIKGQGSEYYNKHFNEGYK